jgi:glycosyltransferase involved in cell wall biosynthesis
MGLTGDAYRHQPGVLIGVHLTVGSQDVEDTLRALYETTQQQFEVAILVDPAPAEAAGVEARLAALRSVRQWHIAAPGGGAASFNRLISENAKVYVFLEAAARPGPDWLGLMLDALDANPAYGLAGPTTNWCWNEQSDKTPCGRTARDVARHARTLKAKHGTSWRAMGPLYSLSDLCLVVRRSVIEATGAADEAYGRGPCWEMDYGVRAARAGFGSAWVKSAFVLRAPRTAARQAAEATLLEANKRLYQDRFCGRRRRDGDAAPYHAHCRGDACANFAPRDATRVHRPLPEQTTNLSERPTDLPLISCVMPTRGRPRFVAQAIAYFHRQDYPNLELVIVYEDDQDLPEVVGGPDIRLVRTANASSIGAKRQAGTEAALGEIIAHWDDDDWYAPERLSRQAAPILDGVADISALNDVMFMLIAARQFWTVTPELFERMFVGNVCGGTLIYRRDVWQRSGPYPATSLREDCDFMVKAMRDGARLCPLPGRGLCIYARHGNNTWKFAEGRFLVEQGWSLAQEPDFLGSDRDFYFGEPTHEPHPVLRPAPRMAQGPLVSCIMPTANRRDFVNHSIKQFLAQDYPRRELIVLDDGEDCIADLVPRHNLVRYVRLDRRRPIGAKRNIACELALGEVIAHWDDDDWMAPAWLSSQVETLLGEGADICGLDKVLFYATETRRGWRYIYDGRQPWAYGGTLCYAKAYWARAPFSRIDVGEDNAFVWSPQPKRMAINVHDDLYIATIHRGNASPKTTTGQRWRELRAPQLEALLRVGFLSVDIG